MIIGGDKCAAVYKLYDEEGDLLYVGMSDYPWRRMNQHKRTKDWFGYVRSVEFEWYSPPEFAASRERLAILIEGPMFNKRRPSAALPIPDHVLERYGREA